MDLALTMPASRVASLWCLGVTLGARRTSSISFCSSRSRSLLVICRSQVGSCYPWASWKQERRQKKIKSLPPSSSKRQKKICCRCNSQKGASRIISSVDHRKIAPQPMIIQLKISETISLNYNSTDISPFPCAYVKYVCTCMYYVLSEPVRTVDEDPKYTHGRVFIICLDLAAFSRILFMLPLSSKKIIDLWKGTLRPAGGVSLTGTERTTGGNPVW